MFVSKAYEQNIRKLDERDSTGFYQSVINTSFGTFRALRGRLESNGAATGAAR
jgi:hypothetical protein